MTDRPISGSRVAAFFDLDGTLIPGSANIPLAKAAFRAGFVSKRELALDLLNNVAFMVRGSSDTQSHNLRERILRAVKGRPAADVEGLTEGFLDGLVATITPAMREIMAEHRDAGHDLVLVSASPTELVQRFAVASGMSYGVGTTAERDENDCYTGVLAGPFCYKEGKAEVVEQLAVEHDYDLGQCFAYSDSESDLPMFTVVGNPVAVNPDSTLRRLAESNGWRVVQFGRLRVGMQGLVTAIRAAGRSPGAAWRAGRTGVARGRESVARRRALNPD